MKYGYNKCEITKTFSEKFAFKKSLKLSIYCLIGCMLLLLSGCDKGTKGIEYKLYTSPYNGDISYMVVGYTGDDENIVIPKEYKNLPIDLISERAFEGKNIRTVEMSDNIELIESFAFSNCKLLEKITLSNSINIIHSNVFRFCANLKSINIPEGVHSISYYAFSSCYSLKEVNLPSTLEDIDNYAFQNCGLESIDIPEGVKRIGEGAFEACNFREVTIPSGINVICQDTFKYCENLLFVSIPVSVTSIGEYAFYKCALQKIDIPAFVTNIGSYAFANCRFEKVMIPKNVTNIHIGAFSYCTDLNEIYISDGVKYIGSSTFLGCHNLVILAQAASKPDKWDDLWNIENKPVSWNVKTYD